MIIKSTFTGLVESPDGNLTVTFRREKLNESMRLDAEAEAITNPGDRADRFVRRVLDLVVDVRGLADDAGNEYTVEQVRAGDVPDAALTPIMAAWFEGRKAKKIDEKKD